MCESISIGIADFVLKVEFDAPETAENVIGLLSKFIVSSDQVDTTLRFHQDTKISDLSDWQEVFNSGHTWKILESKKGDFLAIFQYSNGEMFATFKKDFTTCDIYISTQKAIVDEIFAYRFLQPFFINLLSHGYGILLHAAAVVDGNIGRLFVGNSGAGKSTIASFWHSSGLGRVLCDDRVIVRKFEERYWMYGTPWHGTAGIAVPDGAPLDQIFILNQSQYNHAVRLNPTELSTRLLTRSFPTFWNSEGMVFTLDFLSELSQTVPAYDLEFKKQPDVIEYVRCLQSF